MKLRNIILIIMLGVLTITFGACSKSPTESNSKGNPFKPSENNNNNNDNSDDSGDDNCYVECYYYYDEYGNMIEECYEICDR